MPNHILSIPKDDLKLIGKELKIKDYENYTKKTQQKLWNKIKNTLKDCPSEVCWIKHPLLKNQNFLH